MKFSLFVFILGVGAGAYGLFYWQNQKAVTESKKDEVSVAESGAGKPSLSAQVKEDVQAAKDAVGKELEHAGQTVRTKAAAVGEHVANAASNARIVASIKAKYALDTELKARAIDVDCNAGIVTLHGTVANPALIAKAVTFALDTEGVAKVESQLTVTAEKR